MKSVEIHAMYINAETIFYLDRLSVMQVLYVLFSMSSLRISSNLFGNCELLLSATVFFLYCLGEVQ